LTLAEASSSFGKSCGSASLSGGALILNQTLSTIGSRPASAELTKGGGGSGSSASSAPAVTTSLTIKNESGYELVEVIWNNASFGALAPSAAATRSVQAGSGYVRFKPKTNPVNARTDDYVIVAQNEQKEFRFFNTTLTVRESDSARGTLASFSGVP
jgi:hypothetical protein